MRFNRYNDRHNKDEANSISHSIRGVPCSVLAVQVCVRLGLEPVGAVCRSSGVLRASLVCAQWWYDQKLRQNLAGWCRFAVNESWRPVPSGESQCLQRNHDGASWAAGLVPFLPPTQDPTLRFHAQRMQKAATQPGRHILHRLSFHIGVRHFASFFLIRRRLVAKNIVHTRCPACSFLDLVGLCFLFSFLFISFD